ncbi:hypothetical protein Pmani_015409 [Petrolisthes manimaculis]|uniref:Ionotropic glutamate receptor C-terminal domain-containing protein n=1 Tax=Petrolisthes manimaculis TaxID=1843537 RepID=A0AAE1U7Q0_9EUCA|nr:hypothetical protein Pmani_015408 [Petrolisthes manimaculis]KAK4313232.1 hypothetical protein Pmani_015409 [Petrolisthes manimaculis]
MSTVLVNVRYEPFTLPGNDMEAGLLVSLVLFLLQPSQHTEVVIIHDYTLPGVNKLVESFSERWAATTILTATPAPDLSQLLVALTSFHTNDLRYMVLLCSANTTWTVFDMVSRHNLESRRVRWLVVGEDPYLADTLLYSVREGSMVGLTKRTTSDIYKIYSSYINHNNQMRFQEVGTWTGSNESRLRHPLFPDIVKLYRDFLGRELVTSAVTHMPFIQVKILKNGTKVAERGIDVSIINTLSSHLNFTYRVMVPADRKWGVVQEDGTVIGMVGDVHYRRAHLAVNEITITDSRETVVDFSYPYFFDTSSIVSRGPTEKNRSLAIFHPFSFLMWIVVGLMTLLMGPLGYLFSRVHHQLTQTFDSTHNERSRNVGPSFDSGRIKWGSEPGLRGVEMFCFNMFRTIIIQGNLLPASSWPLRLVFFSWYAFCLILYTVYAGTLTAYLTKPSFTKPINSLEDLVEARERGVVPTVTYGTSTLQIFKTATSGIFKAVYDVMDPAISFPPNVIVDMKNIVEKNTARIAGTVGLEVDAIKYLDIDYHISLGTFNPQFYGVVCPPGAPYTAAMNLVLGQLVQSGLVSKWQRDEVVRMKQKSGQGGGGRNMGQGRGTVKPLTLDHLQGAFYILWCGAVFATNILFIEAAVQHLATSHSNTE